MTPYDCLQIWNLSPGPRVQIGLWPTQAQAGFVVADAHAIKVSGHHSAPSNLITEWIIRKILFGSRQRFPKPVVPYELLKFFGDNILTTEFDEWKRHRKVAAPAFSEVRHHKCTVFLIPSDQRLFVEKQETRF